LGLNEWEERKQITQPRDETQTQTPDACQLGSTGKENIEKNGERKEFR
jgi:hypothetical protein